MVTMAAEMQSFYTPTAPTQISSHASPAVDDLIGKYSFTMSSCSVATVSDPRLKQRRNILQRFADRVRLEYYRYEVTYGIYPMTPGEKLVANTFVIVVLSLLLWASLFYFPSLLYRKLSRLIWLLTGHSGDEMSAVWSFFESGVHTLSSSLSAGGALNS